MTGVFLFVYVATEQAVSGWVASLALRNRATAQFWAAAPSIFWAGVLAGRAITPTLLKKRLPPVLIFAGLALAAAGTFALIVAHTPILELAAGAICGIGLAPIYPLVVAQYATAQDNARGPSGIVFAAGGLGGAVGPLATGFSHRPAGVCGPDWPSHFRRSRLWRGSRVAFRNNRTPTAAAQPIAQICFPRRDRSARTTRSSHPAKRLSRRRPKWAASSSRR